VKTANLKPKCAHDMRQLAKLTPIVCSSCNDVVDQVYTYRRKKKVDSARRLDVPRPIHMYRKYLFSCADDVKSGEGFHIETTCSHGH
jgi:hypothetical protein